MMWVAVGRGFAVLVLAGLAAALGRRYIMSAGRVHQLARESEERRRSLASVYAVLDGFGGGVDERIRELVELRSVLRREAPQLLAVWPRLMPALDADLRFLRALRWLRRPVHPWIRRLGISGRAELDLLPTGDSGHDFFS